ncbi:MAG: T9SS type A sorting domain-containing protein [Bacteroidetes bacterium]|nr:T9SS type A sorting domain-containing protein [Bacteroidota bacterium]MBL0065248.1 T9SS type A sorting domain-containing protein [Bacteroidota bacterium]
MGLEPIPFPFNSNGLSQGVYFIQMISGNQTIQKKIIVE